MGTKSTIERRQFLKLVAGASTGLAVSGCSRHQASTEIDLAGDWPAREEKWISSACLGCAGGCGIMVRVVDGQAVKIEGNPNHPVNRGKLCTIGQAGLQLLYSPDRLKSPMKRVGARGSKKWAAIGWEEAIDTVAARLRELRAANSAHSLVILDGGPAGLQRAMWARLAEAYGSPNHIIDDGGGDGMTLAQALMQGSDRPNGYDLESANFILSFGCGLLDGWRSPVRVARMYGYLRQGRPGGKARIVQIDRRFSVTAARADEWVPTRAGTEGALALGLAYVIMREGLHDGRFLRDHTFGFEDWTDERGEKHMGFKTLVLRDYRPADVSEITGVPVDTIIELAKAFATRRPAVALGDSGATSHTNSTYTAMAIHALNALVGGIEAPGGVLQDRELPLKPWTKVTRDTVAEQGLSMPGISDSASVVGPGIARCPESLHAAALSETPYPVKALFLYQSNPLYSSPHLKSLRRAWSNIPFVVSFSAFLDESAEYADLILPDHTYFEKWQDAPAAPLTGIPTIGIAQPVIDPLYDTMHTGDLVLKLAHSLGGTVAEAFPWTDFKEVMRFSMEGLFEAQRGAVFSDPFQEAHARALQERGWRLPDADSYDSFWEKMVEQGGWWDLIPAYGTMNLMFNTPSGKFEFYSQILKDHLDKMAAKENGKGQPEEVSERLAIAARGDEVYLPHHEPPRWRGEESSFPLALHPFRPPVLAGDVTANLPWLQEIVGPHVYMKWDSWVEVNPDTAGELDVSDGDWVWVESMEGKVLTRAKLYPGAMPGVVNLPTGLGHTALGRWARDRGVNPGDIVNEDQDHVSGRAVWLGTRVRMYKA